MFKKIFLFYLVTLIAYAKMPSIITVDWLKKHLQDQNLVIIDVREEDDFKKSHIQKAINLPRFKYLFDVKHNYMLPPLSFLQDTFSKVGINDSKKVVVYGNNELIWAARFYWISLLLGHKDVGLLKVGFNEAKKYLPTTTKSYKPKRVEFIPKIDNSILETKIDVLMSLHKALIIDGRPPEYYKGLKSLAKRKGHIPSALNYPGSLNYNKEDGLKPLEQLSKIYKNLPKDKKIILYCQDGADAALNFLVLQLLGYKDISIYDGSWLEWGNDFSLPIEK